MAIGSTVSKATGRVLLAPMLWLVLALAALNGPSFKSGAPDSPLGAGEATHHSKAATAQRAVAITEWRSGKLTSLAAGSGDDNPALTADPVSFANDVPRSPHHAIAASPPGGHSFRGFSARAPPFHV